MDHPCHKCRQAIQDGVPFCAHCGAPQIRVTISAPPAQPAPAGDDALPAPDQALTPGSPGIPAISLAVGWPHAVQPCALAAGVAVVLTFLGLNPFVAALGAGVLAVTFYRRRGPGIAIRAGAGARLGALSGLLFFGMSIILEALAVAVLHKGAEIRSEMIDKIQQAATRYPAPEVQPFLDFVRSPGGLTFLIVGSLIFGFIAFLVLSGLGGALSAAFLGRRDRT